MTNPTLVLVHSPLVGPFTWALIAKQLRARGLRVILPTLSSRSDSSEPHWKQHAGAVVEALRPLTEDQPVLLAAHSGAGPLLPAIRAAVSQPVAGYLFVDAGWPVDGKSRLDLFQDAEEVDRFRKSASGGFLPAWSDADLKPVIPNDEIRKLFASELSPIPLTVYEEALPVFAGWPDAPCGTLRFGKNPAYDWAAAQAKECGCVCAVLEGQHFHMLVNPDEVADALMKLAEKMGVLLEN